jgi:hypothetical protein
MSRSKVPREPSPMDRELATLRAQYAADDLSLEDFEAQVANALRKPRTTPSVAGTFTAQPTEVLRYDERWEIHVHDAPPGQSLHIHLA